MKLERMKLNWETVGVAFRAAFAMVNGAWIDTDGKGMAGARKRARVEE